MALMFKASVNIKGHHRESPVYKVMTEYVNYLLDYSALSQYLDKSTKNEIKNKAADNFGGLIQPQILPSISGSILISVYGEFEVFLNKLCDAYKAYKKIDITFYDIHGSGINRAVTYLEKVIGIKNLKSSKAWEQIQHWNVIRNTLVHKAGFIPQKNEKSAEKLGISLVNDIYQLNTEKKLSLNLKNCNEFIDCSKEFFESCIIPQNQA